jgi:CRP-like cAMP-binding protein
MRLNSSQIEEKVKKIYDQDPSHWETKIFRSDQVVFREGELVDKIFYIKDGTFRLFHYDNKIKEDSTIGFLFEGSCFFPPAYLLNEGETMFGLSAVGTNISSQSEICFMTKAKWNKYISKDDDLLGSISVYVLENLMMHLARDRRSNYSIKEELAEMWAEQHPILVKEIKQKYVASYFGVSLAFYNRSIHRIHAEALKKQKN